MIKETGEMQNQDAEFEAAINLSPAAIDALGKLSKRDLREWLRMLEKLKPGAQQVGISCKRLAAELMGMGLIKPATYAGRTLPGLYRIPKAVVFVFMEPTMQSV